MRCIVFSTKINIRNIIQFLTYALIGSTNVLIDLIVLNILWHVTGMYRGNINYLFKLISFSIYSTTGYYLNKRYTFNHGKSTPKNTSSYFGYVGLLAILSFLDAIIISNLTLIHFHHIHKELWANICAVFGAMMTGMIGFIINKLYIFRKQHP